MQYIEMWVKCRSFLMLTHMHTYIYVHASISNDITLMGRCDAMGRGKA